MNDTRESLFSKVKNFIGKDVNEENVSKNLMVVIRLVDILVMVYFFINGIIYYRQLDWIKQIFYIFAFAMFISVFISSYYWKSRSTLWLFNAVMIAWICCFIHLFGWNIGVQHFVIVLLVLCFFSSYRNYTWKLVYTAFLCILRIVLFFRYHYSEPLLKLVSSEENVLQIVNTITIFGSISIIALVFSNNTQELEGKLVDYNELLKEQANTDTLTGLYNRRKALDYMEKLAQGQDGHMGFSLCICDIDFFKKVNDTYGHDYGDEVLKRISEIFMEETKRQRFVARWGGEEFLILFPDCNGDDACIELEEIRKKIKAMRVPCKDEEIKVTMTFGLTEYDAINGLNATIKEADEKLYMGKKNGRDRIVY